MQTTYNIPLPRYFYVVQNDIYLVYQRSVPGRVERQLFQRVLYRQVAKIDDKEFAAAITARYVNYGRLMR